MSSVSVIIPCYRDSKTLARAIESVRAQTCQANEIIVVNDCSAETFEIEEVVKIFPEVIYVKNPVNMGLAATRNAGVEASTSEILTFLDADDELHPQKIEIQLSFLPENGAVTCEAQRIAWDNLRSSTKLFDKKKLNNKLIGENWGFFRNTLVGAAIMIRRETFLQIGGYDPKLRSCEDFDLWFRLISAKAKVVSLNCPLYYYYCNPTGLSRDFKSVSYWETVVLDKNIKFGVMRSFVFMFWLVKHFARARMSSDPDLMDRTTRNSYKYVKPNGLALMCVFLGKLAPLFIVRKLLN